MNRIDLEIIRIYVISKQIFLFAFMSLLLTYCCTNVWSASVLVSLSRSHDLLKLLYYPRVFMYEFF